MDHPVLWDTDIFFVTDRRTDGQTPASDFDPTDKTTTLR